ncbi:protein PAT1 homolog 1 [Aricia agestis]|uniref:protein PAT1 homolog 1 n=1 Tax=Aricia agestis TaxID=91739 RepID=UPI001C208E48|nr:protein PAT1 homolog 1 [Aricia agestis]
MADSFFGFDTSLSNLNDDEGGGEPSEDEYDALNDETFGQDGEGFDWEVEHEHLAEQLESSRRTAAMDEADSRLEASLSQLVLDDLEPPQSRALGSNVWRHDPVSSAPTPLPPLKNVCTVEELERQLRQNQMPQNLTQNYFQPRFPVILQRPPGLQAPVPLPFAPQQSMAMNHQNMNHMNQPMNTMMNQNSQMNQMGQHNQMMPNQMGQNQMGQNMNHLGQNQMGQNINQFMQKSNQMPFHNNQMGQSMNQMPPNMNQVGQNQFLQNQMGQNISQSGQNQNMNQMGQNFNQMNQNQMGQNMNQMGQNVNQMGQNINQMNQNQMGQNMNHMGQNINQMGQNQMVPNGSQFGPGMNQFQQMMGQPRMLAPPPGLGGPPRQNFNPNMNQFNPNFRAPSKNDVNPKSMNQVMKNPQQVNQGLMKTQPLLSPQNKNQKPANRPDPKLQKSRVYNNSKNLTSQNLVQMIQNTHPMLHQYNNSYHNASHHPMLNNRNNMFNNQFNNFQMFNNQRQQNGQFSNTNQHSASDDSSVSSDTDEYAGLMTQREKQWLINIQMLQLNTGTPYIHDFYYTVFLERQANKAKEGVKEAHKANQQNHPFYSGGRGEGERQPRERHSSLRHSTSDEAPRAYVPLQFENSLGKLQCGSVTAPRKIIDVDVVSTEPTSARGSRAPSVASTTNPAEVPREMRRTKQLLLDIEALYLILLRLEELNDPLAISNALILKEREEKQKLMEAMQKEAENETEEVSNLFLKNIESVQRRPKQDSPKMECIDKRQVVNLAVSQKPPVKNLLDEDKEDLLNKMFSGLMHGDRLPQMLTVRKGRALVCRFLTRAPATHRWAGALWARMLRALPAAARRDDAAPLLPALAAPYRNFILNSTAWTAVLMCCGIFTEALDPARTPYILLSPLTLSCVCALIEKAILLVNTPEATSSERQWYRFLKTLARALKNTTLSVGRPTKPLPESKVLHHLKQLESRTTIEILQRGKTAEFGDLTKTDVSEQLIKHLC